MTIKTAISRPRGINFAGGLALLFIGLKLTGVIDWSWWWVLAPMWGSLVLTFIAGVATGVAEELRK